MFDQQCPKCKSRHIALSKVTYRYSSPLFLLRKEAQGKDPTSDLRRVWGVRILLLIMFVIGFSMIVQGGVPVRGSPKLISFSAAPIYSIVVIGVCLWLVIGFFISFKDEAKIRNVQRYEWYECADCRHQWVASGQNDVH